jgi:hypothetical protein
VRVKDLVVNAMIAVEEESMRTMKKVSKVMIRKKLKSLLPLLHLLWRLLKKPRLVDISDALETAD